MNITECRSVVTNHKHLIGKTVSYLSELYLVTDVIMMPNPKHMPMFLNDYERWGTSERAISKYLSAKDLNVGLYCENSNGIRILLINEVEVMN